MKKLFYFVILILLSLFLIIILSHLLNKVFILNFPCKELTNKNQINTHKSTLNFVFIFNKIYFF